MRVLVAFLVLWILAMPVLAAQAPAISVLVARYEPFPAQAGQTADIWLKVDNTGSATRNLTVGISPQYPYSVLSEPANIGILNPYESVYVKQRVLIDESAPQGEMKIRLWYVSDGVRVEKDYSILVENKPEFVVSYAGMPVTGRITPLEISVTALKSPAKDVVLSFSGDFLVMNSSRVYVGDIGKGEKRTVLVNVKPRESMEFGTLNLNISYSYGNSVQKTDSMSLGIGVLDIPEVVASMKSASDGKAEIEVINRGHGTARFLTAYCNASPPISYIGNLMPDDFDSFEVSASGILQCNITYLSGGKEVTDSYEFPIPREGGGFPIWAVVVVAAAAGLGWWLRR